MPYGFIRRRDYDSPPDDQPANVAANHSVRPHVPELDDTATRIHTGAILLVARYCADPVYRRVVATAVLILEHDAINASSGRRRGYATDLAEARRQVRTARDGGGGPAA